LFDDPWAERLAGPEGFAALERHDPSGNRYLALRTWWLDRWCLQAATTGYGQIVVLGAGLDTRAFRLPWPAGVVAFELDRPEVLNYKEPVLAAAGATRRCDRRLAAADLSGTWQQALTEAGFDAAARTAWVVEGLLVYLTEPAARALLVTAADLTAAGGKLAGDIVGRSFLTSPWTQSYLHGLADAGVPWQYGTDKPELLLTATGWTPEAIVQPADVVPASRAWTFPASPRDLNDGVPRSYLFAATRPPQ
jgi:methyltransferase (TIGR00027 family)